MDGSEAQLISCWTRCCNLEVIFIVVKPWKGVVRIPPQGGPQAGGGATEVG